MNSPRLIFSIIRNVDLWVNKDKDINLLTLVHPIHFERIKEYYKIHCNRLFNELENNYFRVKDLIVYLLYCYIFEEKINLNDIVYKKINDVSKLFTLKQLEEDKQFIINLQKELKLKNGIQEYFTFLNDGNNIIYNLIKKKYISPIFFMKYSDKLLTKEKENNIFVSNEFKRFKKISEKIKTIIKGDV